MNNSISNQTLPISIESLAPFYIIKIPRQIYRKKEDTQVIVDNFLSNYVSNKKNISLDNAIKIIQGGHPDLLTLRPASNKAYTYSDFEEFFKFQSFSPIELPHRFITIFETEKISKNILNKLLKSLEDGGDIDTSVIFLSEDDYSFISTIESRAIILKIRPIKTLNIDSKWSESNNLRDNFYSLLHLQNINDELSNILIKFLQTGRDLKKLEKQLKINPQEADKICQAVIELETEHLSNYEIKNNILNNIRDFQISYIYNCSPLIRTLIIIQQLL